MGGRRGDAGTTGKSLQMEAIQIRLRGAKSYAPVYLWKRTR